MPKYAVSLSSASGSTSAKKTMIGLDANATGENFEVVEAIMTGSGGATAADNQHVAGGYACSFAGTGTSTGITPEPFYQQAPASSILAGVNYSAEPTSYSAVAHILFGFNQRGGMRWAVPQGEGIRFHNAVEESGFGWTVLGGSAAGVVDATVHYWENQ